MNILYSRSIPNIKMLEMKRKKKNYVDPKRFTELLIEHKKRRLEAEKNGLPKPHVPEEIGEILLKIAENLSKISMFSRYTYKEDMISDGVINCLLYLDNFDPEISTNSFAYFTQIIKFAYFRRMETEQKESYVKFKSLENSELFKSIAGETNKNVNLLNGILNEKTDNIITKFEEKMEKKKQKRQKPELEVKNHNYKISDEFIIEEENEVFDN